MVVAVGVSFFVTIVVGFPVVVVEASVTVVGAPVAVVDAPVAVVDASVTVVDASVTVVRFSVDAVVVSVSADSAPHAHKESSAAAIKKATTRFIFIIPYSQSVLIIRRHPLFVK